MKFLTDIYRSVLENPMLAGILALVVLVLFIVHPLLGLIALGGSGFILWVIGGFSDEDYKDEFKVDDSEGMKLPPDDK